MKRSATFLASLLAVYFVLPVTAMAAPAVQGEFVERGTSLNGAVTSDQLIPPSDLNALLVVALGSALFLAVTAATYLHRRPRSSGRRPSAATGI